MPSVPTGGTEGCGHAGSLSGGGIDARVLDGEDRQRDTDIGHGADVGGDGSARGHESDVDNLDGSTDEDARLHIAHDDADDEAGDQRTTQSVVADRRATHARQ